MDRQTGKLIARIAENLPEMDKAVMQNWIDNPKDLQKFLLGLNTPKIAESPDFTVYVIRTVKLNYPHWVEGLLCPELESTGPSEYNIQTEVQPWLHEGQKSGAVKGRVIYNHLKSNNELVNQLGHADLLAIQAKGIGVFDKLYGRKILYGWRSVVRYTIGELRVPYLFRNSDDTKVELNWASLDFDWGPNDFGLCFSK